MWEALPPEVRERVDALVMREQRLPAVKAVFDAGLVPRPGLDDCVALVADRYRVLGKSWGPKPSDPLDADELTAAARGVERVEAIEAVWDGDTDGWFVLLLAVAARPEREHVLASVRRGGDIRVFNGQVPPWPEAVEAARVGAEVAARLGVPFHFASPDEPDDEAPRWWSRSGRG
ncbi:hypothetical protein ACIBF1_01215 [Spirillospora sp. NPDC050679]